MSDNTRAAQCVDLLYIHPHSVPFGFSLEDIIPMGVFALMNSVTCSKTGKMYYEVDEKTVKNAKIIAMDLHWYFHLYGAGKLAHFVKRNNPDARIIIGGYTATVFAEILVNRFNIDFVIKGDAEYSFPLLVESLLKHKEVEDIPNIVGRDFVSCKSYVLNQADYDQSDYTNCDWFWTYKKNMYAYQRNRNAPLVSPWISVFKGCKYNCDYCYGNPALQREVSGRGIVARSPESVAKELTYYSNDDNIKVVHIAHDFIDVLGENYADKIFSRKYDLNLYYEFFNLPELSMLGKMLSSFNYCYLAFSADLDHSGKRSKQDFTYLNSLLEYLKNQNCGIKIFVDASLGFKPKFEGYLDEIIKLYLKHHVTLGDCGNFAIPIPYPKENRDELEIEFDKFYNLTSDVPHFSENIKAMFLTIIFKSSVLTFLMRKVRTVFTFVDIIFKSLAHKYFSLRRAGGHTL